MVISQSKIDAARQEIAKKDRLILDEARKRVVDLLAEGKVNDAVKLASERRILNEVPKKYLRRYADLIMERGSVSSGKLRQVADIYRRLGKLKLAEEADSRSKVEYDKERISTTVAAMTN